MELVARTAVRLPMRAILALLGFTFRRRSLQPQDQVDEEGGADKAEYETVHFTLHPVSRTDPSASSTLSLDSKTKKNGFRLYGEIQPSTCGARLLASTIVQLLRQLGRDKPHHAGIDGVAIDILRARQ